MTLTTHTCPGGCGRDNVARHKFACPGCWYRLPGPLRRAISSAFLVDTQRHAEAMAAARTWYAATAATADVTPPPPGTRKTELGQVFEWTGTAWRVVTRAEIDREAWRA